LLHQTRMPAISSPHNEKLKEVRKLQARRRDRELVGRFVAEGEDLLAAADAHGWTALERFCAAGSGLPGTEVDVAALASVAELASGTRALAIYEERFAPAPLGPVCVYLHGIRDPGNVGTVLRSAEAFGAGSVALGPDSADPFSPKAVRASMGAVFVVPVCRTGTTRQTVVEPASLPGTTVALDGDGPRTLAEVAGALTPGDDLTILVGSERHGLPNELLGRADHVARIPILSHSLNAAMAATVALYELTSVRSPEH
jgi:RNA methyltransferase, TrmH family